MKTLPVLSALLIIVVVVSLVPGLARGSAAADPLPPPQPSDLIESQRQSSPSTQAQVAAPDSMPGRVPIVLYASKGVAPFRIAPRLSPALRRAQHTTFTINYIPAGTQNELGDNCLSWPAGSQAAFQYAADLWGALLSSSVPIKIDACWASLGEGILGHSATDSFYRNFTGAPQSNTWYSVALANALSGVDRNGNTAEMHIAYSSSSSFTWYFGTDGNPPMGEYDFVSVVLHEIAHGLNFAGSMRVSVGQGSWGFTGYPNVPVIYDRFAEDGNAVSLLNTGAYPNPSLALGNALRGQVSGVYFNGTNAKAANGNSRVKLYTPSTWQSGSSYAHLDEMFNGTANALMTYSLDDGEAMHDPGPITCGIFRDLGWQSPCANTPIVGIRKAVLGSDWKPGDRITFTLSIANTGAVAATSVVVTDIIPVQVLTPIYDSSLVITPIGGSSFVWNVGTLGIGQSGVITIYGQIDPSLTSGWSFSNIASISDPADTTPDNKSSRVMVGGVKVYLPVIMRNWPPLQTVNLSPVADTYVLAGSPSSNYGTFTIMRTGYDHCYGWQTARGLMQFNLSSIPVGAYVTQAKLYLYLTGSCDMGQRTHVETAYRVSSSWSEGSVTWNTQPGYAEGDGSVSIPSRTWGWYSFDVTNLVRGWANGNFPNYGLAVRGPESSGDDSARLDFDTRHSSTYPPYLTVQYYGATSASQDLMAVTEPDDHHASCQIAMPGALDVPSLFDGSGYTEKAMCHAD